jgi:hypothetical protein
MALRLSKNSTGNRNMFTIFAAATIFSAGLVVYVATAGLFKLAGAIFDRIPL